MNAIIKVESLTHVSRFTLKTTEAASFYKRMGFKD